MSAPDPPPAARGQAFTGRFEEPTRRLLPASGAVHLHLLRHGEVARLSERVLWGQEDVPLSPEGERQGAALARWLLESEPRADRVVSSDLARCRALGELLADALGVELELEPRLREQHLGAWQGKTWDEISAADPARVRACWDDYAATRPPDGESLADVAARAGAWWRERKDALVGRRVLVSTHIGVVRALCCELLGLPLDQALRLAPATGSHTHLAVSDAGAVLTALGERPWSFAGSGGA